MKVKLPKPVLERVRELDVGWGLENYSTAVPVELKLNRLPPQPMTEAEYTLLCLHWTRKIVGTKPQQEESKVWLSSVLDPPPEPKRKGMHKWPSSNSQKSTPR